MDSSYNSALERCPLQALASLPVGRSEIATLAVALMQRRRGPTDPPHRVVPCVEYPRWASSARGRVASVHISMNWCKPVCNTPGSVHYRFGSHPVPVHSRFSSQPVPVQLAPWGPGPRVPWGLGPVGPFGPRAPGALGARAQLAPLGPGPKGPLGPRAQLAPRNGPRGPRGPSP